MLIVLGHAELGLDRVQPGHGVAQRDAVRQVERDTVTAGSWPSWLMVRGPAVRLTLGEGGERHELARRCVDADLVEPLGRPGEPRIELDDHRVVVAGGVDRRDLPRAEAAVERRAELLGGDAERADLVAVDVDLRLQRRVLEIVGDVDERLVAAACGRRAAAPSRRARPARGPARRTGTGSCSGGRRS